MTGKAEWHKTTKTSMKIVALQTLVHTKLSKKRISRARMAIVRPHDAKYINLYLKLSSS